MRHEAWVAAALVLLVLVACILLDNWFRLKAGVLGIVPPFILRHFGQRHRIGPLWRAIDDTRLVPSRRTVIVSLTVIPPRLADVGRRLRFLDRSQVSEIHINLPHTFARTGEAYPPVPPDLMSMPKIRVFRLSRDLGPMSKLLPTLDRVKDPNAIVITLDDDIGYDHAVVPQLLWEWRRFGAPRHAAIANVVKFPEAVRPWMSAPVLEGFAGVLYPRSLFQDEAINMLRLAVDTECFVADDVAISMAIERFGGKILHASHRPHLNLLTSYQDGWGLNSTGRPRQAPDGRGSYQQCAHTMFHRYWGGDAEAEEQAWRPEWDRRFVHVDKDTFAWGEAENHAAPSW